MAEFSTNCCINSLVSSGHETVASKTLQIALLLCDFYSQTVFTGYESFQLKTRAARMRHLLLTKFNKVTLQQHISLSP